MSSIGMCSPIFSTIWHICLRYMHHTHTYTHMHIGSEGQGCGWSSMHSWMTRGRWSVKPGQRLSLPSFWGEQVWTLLAQCSVFRSVQKTGCKFLRLTLSRFFFLPLVAKELRVYKIDCLRERGRNPGGFSASCELTVQPLTSESGSFYALKTCLGWAFPLPRSHSWYKWAEWRGWRLFWKKVLCFAYSAGVYYRIV